MKKLIFGLAMMSVCCACQEKIQYPQAAKENAITAAKTTNTNLCFFNFLLPPFLVK